MVEVTNLKAGKTFLMNGKPYRVVKYTHQKIARGGGTVKLSLRNLETGSFEEKTFSSNTKVDEVNTIKKNLQYLYNDDVSAVFIDPKNYDQMEIPLKVVGDKLVYIKEGANVDILFWDPSTGSGEVSEMEPLSVDIPAKVTLKVTETTPGVKGDSATNFYKPATLENGLKIKVPLFIKKGEAVRVDTRTGEYVERVK